MSEVLAKRRVCQAVLNALRPLERHISRRHAKVFRSCLKQVENVALGKRYFSLSRAMVAIARIQAVAEDALNQDRLALEAANYALLAAREAYQLMANWNGPGVEKQVRPAEAWFAGFSSVALEKARKALEAYRQETSA